MDVGNVYEDAPTYVVMPDGSWPPVESEGVLIVEIESSNDSSDRTITEEHERSGEKPNDDDTESISGRLSKVASRIDSGILTTDFRTLLTENEEW